MQSDGLALEQWPGGCALTPELFEDLFTQSADHLQQCYGWQAEQAVHFGGSDGLDHHYGCQRLDHLTHKASFSLQTTKLKACSLRNSVIRVNESPVEWHALVSDCQILLSYVFHGARIHLLDAPESMVLDAKMLGAWGRRLDVAQLGQPRQWCYVVSRSELRFSFGPGEGLFIINSAGTRCDLQLGHGFLEYWCCEPVRPLRYSVDNARMLYRIQAMARGVPCDDNPLYQGPLRMSARYYGPHGSFSSDMERFVQLVTLQVEMRDPVPRFLMHGQQMPVTRGVDTLTVYDTMGLALADVRRDEWRGEPVLRFQLLYGEEQRYIDWAQAHSYKD